MAAGGNLEITELPLPQQPDLMRAEQQVEGLRILSASAGLLNGAATLWSLSPSPIPPRAERLCDGLTLRGMTGSDVQPLIIPINSKST